jgi:hypothetical protein
MRSLQEVTLCNNLSQFQIPATPVLLHVNIKTFIAHSYLARLELLIGISALACSTASATTTSARAHCADATYNNKL